MIWQWLTNQKEEKGGVAEIERNPSWKEYIIEKERKMGSIRQELEIYKHSPT